MPRKTARTASKRPNERKAKREALVRATLDEVRQMPTRTDFKRLAAMTEEDIERAALDDPDALPMTYEELEQAMSVPAGKALPVTIRIDPDVLAFFREAGPGYQTRMNRVLRAFVNAARRRQAPKKKAAAR